MDSNASTPVAMLEQIEFGMAGLADSGLQLEGLELAAQDVDSAEDLAVVSEHRESADIPEMTDTPEPAEALAEAPLSQSVEDSDSELSGQDDGDFPVRM